MQQTIINSKSDSLGTYFKKIWANRSLIVTLAKRDLKAKYAQTGLGLLWTVLQPITGLIIYTFFFHFILKFETEDPYILFVLTGLICWNLFVNVFTQGSMSLINAQELIRKLYFPKIVLPLSKALVAIIELILSVFLLIVFILFLDIKIKLSILIAPIFLLFVVLLALGMAFIFSALTIKKRDLHHIIPYLISFGIWFTPVFYPISIIPNKFAEYVYLNPLASLIQLFRNCILSDNNISFVALSLTSVIAIFSLGFFLFKNIEDKIADNL